MSVSHMLGSVGGNELLILECLAKHISYYQFMKNQLSFTKAFRIAGVRIEECSKNLSNMKRFNT